MPIGKLYSRGDDSILSITSSDEENVFTYEEYGYVLTADDVYASQSAVGEYAVYVFKDKHTTNLNQITINWEGQTDYDPITSPVTLEIYNFSTNTWEILDSEVTAGANVDFTLTGSIAEDTTEYYDPSYWIVCRVYQEAK